MEFPERLNKKLQERELNNSLRSLSLLDLNNKIDFYSNDYLGIARNKELATSIYHSFNSENSINRLGSTGSRLLSGNTSYTEALEAKLSRFFDAESGLLFNSGYAANSSLIPSIATRGDIIIYDELSHASTRDGCLLSFAKSYSFRHNSLESLEIILSKHQNTIGNIYVILESVYSMDGDICPLVEAIRLCESYGAYCILDEAHSTGLYGQGKGLAYELNIHDKIFARIHTFGKAVGAHGAFVACSKRLSAYLTNFARGFIYSTALPLHSLITIEKAISFIHENPDSIHCLFDKIEYLNQLMAIQSASINYSFNTSPIQTVLVGNIDKCKSLSSQLEASGLAIKPILSPTVPIGSERIRICIHNFNTESELDKLAYQLSAQ